MRLLGQVVLAVGAILCLTTPAPAQTTGTTTETKQFEVIAVSGNDVVVKLPEGTRELKVPDDFRFTVDGQPMSVHQLKPGMKGTATITSRTTMTPVTVTEIKEGTVEQITDSSVVVRTSEGRRELAKSDLENSEVEIVRDGHPARASDLRAGDTLSATIITSLPPVTVTQRQVEAAVDTQPAQAEPSPVGTTGSASEPAWEAPQQTAPSEPQQTATRELPRTAGPLPLIGFIGLASLAVGTTLAVRRRRSES